MFNSKVIAGLFSAATVFTVTNAYAQAPSAQDKSFMVKACQGNHAEIAASKLALKKSSDAKVRGIAQTIVSEHSANEVKLQALADKYNVKLPNAPDAKHKAMAKKLARMSGTAFDNAYIGGQIADHHATIALLEKEMAKGSNSETRSFATDTLGAVLKHTDSIHKVSGTSSNKTMHKMKSGNKMDGMKTSMASPASKVNAQIRSLNAVENKSFAAPSATSGIFSRTVGSTITNKNGSSVTRSSTVTIRPTPQPVRAPGLD